MAAEKTLRKQDQPRSTSASGCLSSSRDDLRKTVIRSQHDRRVRSRPSSQTLGSPDCSQYLEDYRSYLEHKDRDEPTDVQTGSNRSKHTAEKQSNFQGNCEKFRSLSASYDKPAKKLTSSPVPSRDSTVRPNSIGGSIIGKTQRPLEKNSPGSRTGSLRPPSRCRSSQLDDASSEGKFLPKSATDLRSTEGRSTQRLPSFGIASVEVKSDRNDKILTRNSEEVAVQTDPELAGNVVRNSCVQTDDVRDDLSYSESDVSIGGYNDTKSDQDDEINDVKSDNEDEDDDGNNREVEDFSRGDDENISGTGVFTVSYEDLSTSRRDGIKQPGCPSRSGNGRNCEFDSGLENTVSQELSSVWDRVVKSDQQRSDPDKDGSQRKPHQRVRQFFDFGQQTIDFQSTQTPTGLERTHPRVLGVVSPGHWLLMDSGKESGVYLEPWTTLGMTEVDKRRGDRKVVRDFATQTFRQVSCETQTNTEEWHKYDRSAYRGLDNDLESHICNHGHTSRRLKDRPDNNAEVQKDGKEEGEDRWSHDRTYNDQWDDNLTEEIIQVFRDTRRLIAKTKAGKQPEAKMSSGKRQLLEKMLREVQNLQCRVTREDSVERDVRAFGNDGGRPRRKKSMKMVDSDSAIESSEDEGRRQRTELLRRTSHDRRRRRDRSPRHSERNTAIERGRHGGRHHSKSESDSRYKRQIARRDRTEHRPERHQGFLQNVPPPISQELPPRYQSNNFYSHDSKFWGRSNQEPPLAHYQSALPWHNQRPTQNLYAGQFPHPFVGPTSLPVSAAPSVYWRQPTPIASLPSGYQHLQNSNHTSLRSGTGTVGVGGAFRPTQAASILQKPNVVYFPGAPVGTVHPGLPIQGQPPVLLSQQGYVSYVPTQSSRVVSSQPSEVHLAVRPTQGEGLPVGPAQQATKSVITSQYPPQTSAQRRRRGLPRRWKDSEFEFEKCIKEAALEAERIKELSTRLLRQSASQTVI